MHICLDGLHIRGRRFENANDDQCVHNYIWQTRKVYFDGSTLISPIVINRNCHQLVYSRYNTRYISVLKYGCTYVVQVYSCSKAYYQAG